MEKQKGQINITTILGWALALALAAGGSYVANLAANRSRIDGLEAKNTAVVQRVTAVETNTATLKEDIKSIKDDIREILRRTK